jgi:hypothetical protein
MHLSDTSPILPPASGAASVTQAMRRRVRTLIASLAGKIGRRVRRLAEGRPPVKPAPTARKAKPPTPPSQSVAPPKNLAPAKSAAPATAPDAAAAARPCYVAVASDCGHCNDGCRASQRDWQAWLEKTFKGFRPLRSPASDLSPADRASIAEDERRFGGKLSVTKVPPAILDLTVGHDAYWQLIGAKGRNMVRKAEKLGYGFAQFSWNEHIDDIFAVNTSMSHRGGKEMTAGYRERPSTIGASAFCDRQLRMYYGAFKEGTLYAYLVLVVFGHFATINTILGHGDHLKDGIMNGLIDFLVRDLASEGKVRYVNYLTLKGGRESLDSFKKRVGFEERNAIFLSGISRAG